MNHCGRYIAAVSRSSEGQAADQLPILTAVQPSLQQHRGNWIVEVAYIQTLHTVGRRAWSRVRTKQGDVAEVQLESPGNLEEVTEDRLRDPPLPILFCLGAEIHVRMAKKYHMLPRKHIREHEIVEMWGLLVLSVRL